MSQTAGHLFGKCHKGGFLGLLGGDEQGRRRHNHGKLRDQLTAALDAAIHADTAAAGHLGLSNRSIEKFWDANAVQHFRHCNFPAMVVGADAQGNSGKNLSQVASGIAPHPTKYGDPVLEQFATGARA